MDEARIVTRSIELTWGGERRALPVLPMKPADDWRRLFVEKFPDTDGEEVDAATALHQAGDGVLDLLVAYDRSKVLGNREWIEANVTDDELADAFVEVYQRSFRLGRLPKDLAMALLGRPPAKSPSSRLPTGTLTPIASDNGSPTNS